MPDPEDDHYVESIDYATASYKKELSIAFRESIQKELNKDKAEDNKNADLHI